MEVYCKGTAQIRHSATGRIYKVESIELDWDAIDSIERSMGQEIHYEAVVEHPQLGTLTWSLWEYPVGIENHRETDVGAHEVIEDLDYGLEPEHDEWLDYTPPDNPFAVFMDSYHETGDLLADHSKDGRSDLLNRLVFSQQITAMEAYLGDTLLNEVMADPDTMQRLIDKDEDLAQEKFTLAEISKDPGLIPRKVREHLQSILWHNLPKVDALYDIALEVRILKLANDKPSLFKAVQLRHDCVHRNGFDKDGAQLTAFTKSFVQGAADLIKEFVEKIENAVALKRAARSNSST